MASRHKEVPNLKSQQKQTEASIDMLQSDQKVLDEEVQSLRKGLHKKVNRLLDAQGKATTQGFDLTPLDVDELKKLKY